MLIKIRLGSFSEQVFIRRDTRNLLSTIYLLTLGAKRRAGLEGAGGAEINKAARHGAEYQEEDKKARVQKGRWIITVN